MSRGANTSTGYQAQDRLDIFNKVEYVCTMIMLPNGLLHTNFTNLVSIRYPRPRPSLTLLTKIGVNSCLCSNIVHHWAPVPLWDNRKQQSLVDSPGCQCAAISHSSPCVQSCVSLTENRECVNWAITDFLSQLFLYSSSRKMSSQDRQWCAWCFVSVCACVCVCVYTVCGWERVYVYM